MSSPALSGAERGLTVLLAGPSAAGFLAGRQPCFSSASRPLKPMQSPAPGAASGRREAVCTTVYQPLQGPTTSLASLQPPLDRRGLRELLVRWAGSVGGWMTGGGGCGTTLPPKAGRCVGGAQGRRGPSGSPGGCERPVVSYHFYLAPTQSPPVAIFTQCSHLITPRLSVVSLHLASKFFFFPKSSEVPRSAAARGSAIYKQVLPLAGAKTSITTHLPTVPLKRAISFATRSQPGKHLRVQTLQG